MFCYVAIATDAGVATVSFCAVPWEEILVFVEGPAEGAPVVPVFLKGVYEVCRVVKTIAKFEQVFFCEAAGDVVFCFGFKGEIAGLGRDEAEQVEGIRRGI